MSIPENLRRSLNIAPRGTVGSFALLIVVPIINTEST